MTRLRAAVVSLLAIAARPAAAAPPLLDLPAGRFGAAVAALGAQAGISVAVDDPGLWSRRVPAVRGRLSPRAAIARLLANADATAVEVAPGWWRIRTRPRATPTATPRPTAADDERIVVTASKRDTRLADFAGTVALIDGRNLGVTGPAGTEAVLSRLSSVASTYLGAGRDKLFIRGIADSSFTGPTQATVGQYVGDLRLTYNAPDPDLRLYDMAGVDVLEGPQGTLYGAGSLGGIVRLTPAPPDPDRAGGAIAAGATLTARGEAGGDLSATANLPLGQRRALRLVGYRVVDGGYIDNTATGRRDVNRTATTGGRAALRVLIDGGWTIDVGGIVQTIRSADSQYAEADAPRLTRSGRVAEPSAADYRLVQFVVSRDWRGLHFRSSTGAAAQRLAERFDATPPGAAPRLFAQANATRLVASEMRLWQPMGRRFGWLIGASYTRNRARLDRSLGPAVSPRPITGVINLARDLTAYGEASLKPASWLTATAGGRASWTRVSGGALHIPPAAPTPEQQAERARIVASRDGAIILPSASLVARAADGVTLFARYQQGFRPGGLTYDRDFLRRFRSDRVATVEVGLRLRPGPRLDLTAGVSRTRWRDVQADFVDPTGLVNTANIGDGRIRSVAATAAWRPVAALRLDAAITANHGRVTTIAAAGPAAADASRRIPNVAGLSARLGAAWERRLGDRLTLRAEMWGRYVGRSRLGIGPVLGRTQGDYLDSVATVRVGTATIGATLGLTNVADAAGNRFALGTPFAVGRSQITPLRPRTVRLGLDALF